MDSHGQALPMEVDEWMPPRRLVTRVADPKLLSGGTWTFEISPAPGGRELRIPEKGEIYNPILCFMALFLFSYTATLDEYLRALGGKFGEGIQVES